MDARDREMGQDHQGQPYSADQLAVQQYGCAMNEMTKPADQGRRALDHQRRRREAVLVREMRRRSGQEPSARSCSCTARRWPSQPTFDLQVPGRPYSSAMDYFARRGFDCWSVDMEGYGRSTKDRDNNAPISQGADDCYAAALYIQKLRGKRPFLVYGISSGALARRDVRRTPPRDGGAARARRHGVDRRRLADAGRAAQEAARVQSRSTAGR